MKIFVSEKYFKNIGFETNSKIELMENVDLGIFDEEEGWEIVDEFKEGSVIKSLEQHEQEIRKPLEDAIVKLNEFVVRLISEKEPETAREITERHHREIMLERQNKFLEEEIERLKKQLDLNDKEHFKNALKQLRETDYDTIRKIERLKVIAELEEWANTCHLVESIYEGIYCIDKDDLKQKLNEMKGEK